MMGAGTAGGALSGAMAGTGAAAADAALAAYGGGMLAAEGAAVPGAMTFVTPAVTEGGALAGAGAGAGSAAGAGGAGGGATGVLGGGEASAPILGEAPVGEGMLPGAYSDVAGEKFAMANKASPMTGYLKSAGKAASTYSTVNKAMGGEQPQRRAPQGRPIFQGEAAPIAPTAPAASNNNAVLAAIARRRQRGF
ncbi:hypothetical protein QPK31_23220 [Massilia sp. YIM B02769]|uniref:hypothetical protein n=1 Tax=Massilia sp. YIM B02769 TaxID=3050129 RepID=UPI0025B70E62|nr:hypothetical protein [Massilia sp. YIM B02769]MDN4061134.1 hypothetical protein [Massilia sp. YIM B02769]